MRQRAAAFEYRPLFSIIVPVHNATCVWLERLVASVCAQTYDRWELLLVDDASDHSDTQAALQTIANGDERIVVERLAVNRGVVATTNYAVELAHGEFLAFVDHDDELMPDALWWVADHLQRQSDCDLFYTDEELVPDDGGPACPHFKPDFSPELLTAYNYMCHLLVVRRQMFERVGKLRAGTDGAQDFDLVLRIISQNARVAHIPRILYRWHLVRESISRTWDDEQKQLRRNSELDRVTAEVVQAHLDRHQIPAQAKTFDGWVRPKFEPTDWGKVSIIICTRDHPRLLLACVRSIERLTEYPNYEILIVDNGSRTWLGKWCLRLLARRHRVVHIASGREGFNFARINNQAANMADGKYLLFLNDDTRVLTSGWLSAMTGHLQFKGVGAVGARLVYPNGRNQHAGLIVGAMGWGPWHALMHAPESDDRRHYGYLRFPHNCLAVTGACMLTPRELFQRLGGFDDQKFKVSFNDVDYCLRLFRNGYRCVYAPQAKLIHHEGQSRGRVADPKELTALRHRYLGIDDPYWNPNFDRHSNSFLVSPRRRARRLSNSKPRVLITGPPSRDGDPWPHWETLADELSSRGSCRVSSLAHVHADHATVLEAFRARVRREPCDAVVVHGWQSWPVIEDARRWRIPSIWHVPGRLLANRPVDPQQSAEIIRIARALRLPYQVLFTDTFSRESVFAGALRENFSVLDGVLIGQQRSTPPDGRARANIRREWGIDESTLVLLCVTLLEDDCGWQTVLRAFQTARRRCGRNLSLLLVAEDSRNYRVMARCHRAIRKLKADVVFVASPSRIADYYAAADIFIGHSTIDVRPRAVLEALAAGLPIVGSRELEESNLLYPGATGSRFDRFRVASLSRALLELIKSDKLRMEFGKNAREWLDSRARPESVITTLQEMILEASEISLERPLSVTDRIGRSGRSQQPIDTLTGHTSVLANASARID